MLRSSSNHSSNRNNSERQNSPTAFNHYRSMPTLFKKKVTSKKHLSSLLNNADFEICSVPNESEMMEIMPNSNNTAHQSEFTMSDNTIIDQQQPSAGMHNGINPTTTNKKYLLSELKHRLIPHRCDTTKRDENEDKKNQGFLLVDQVDADLVLINNDTFDQQSTRHPELCDFGPAVDDDNIEINRMQLIPITSPTPTLLPPPPPVAAAAAPQPILASLAPVLHLSNHETDIQATQAGVECATPLEDQPNIHDTQVSATNSSSSTNSSNNDSRYAGIDRSTLDDDDYVQAQKHDLERITLYTIDLNNDLRDWQHSVNMNEKEKTEFLEKYKEDIAKNTQIKEDLKRLEKIVEDLDRIYGSWICEVCTFINESYSITGKDVCEMCEGPSPLKRHTLTN